MFERRNKWRDGFYLFIIIPGEYSKIHRPGKLYTEHYKSSINKYCYILQNYHGHIALYNNKASIKII